MVDVGHHGAEASLVRQHFASQRQAHQRAAVEGALEGDDARAASRKACNLDGVLHRFDAGGEEGSLGRAINRGQCVDAFSQRNRAFVGHDLVGGVREVRQLLLHGSHDAVVAVAGVEHRNAGGEVDVLVAFDVGDQGVVGLSSVEVTHHAHTTGCGGKTALLEFGIGSHGFLGDIC